MPQPRVSALRQYVSNGYCRVDQTPTPSKPPPGTSNKQGAACLVAPRLSTRSLYSSPKSSSARRGAPLAPSSAFVLVGASFGARNVFVGSKTSTEDDQADPDAQLDAYDGYVYEVLILKEVLTQAQLDALFAQMTRVDVSF